MYMPSLYKGYVFNKVSLCTETYLMVSIVQKQDGFGVSNTRINASALACN